MQQGQTERRFQVNLAGFILSIEFIGRWQGVLSHGRPPGVG
jgi:hypothetical protein